MTNEARKYFVKQSMIFNLESMNDKLNVLIYEVLEEGKTLPSEIAGTKIKDFDDIYALIDECGNLECIAKIRKVTGREYGRIKQISDWRNGVRYARCLESGMSEADAGKCFED